MCESVIGCVRQAQTQTHTHAHTNAGRMALWTAAAMWTQTCVPCSQSLAWTHRLQTSATARAGACCTHHLFACESTRKEVSLLFIFFLFCASFLLFVLPPLLLSRAHSIPDTILVKTPLSLFAPWTQTSSCPWTENGSPSSTISGDFITHTHTHTVS